MKTTDGGCVELGVQIGLNELTFPIFHTALSPQGVLWALCSGITQGIAGQVWIPWPSWVPRKCLSLQTQGIQSKVAVLVFATIQSVWRWQKNWKSCQRWGGQVPAAHLRCAVLSQHHHTAQVPGHWCELLAGSPRFYPAVCPESQQVLLL